MKPVVVLSVLAYLTVATPGLPAQEAAGAPSSTAEAVQPAAPAAVAAPAPAAECVGMDEVWASLERITGEPAPRTVPCHLMGAEELEGYLRREITEDNTVYDIARQERTLRLLGFQLGSAPLEASVLKLLRDGVAGFYDPSEDHFYQVSQPPPSKTVKKADPDADGIGNFVTLLHEADHARQDTLVDLEALARVDPHNWDRQQAIDSVIEGEATLVMTLGLFDRMGVPREAWPDALSRIGDLLQAVLGEAPEGPRVLVEPLVRSYADGFLWCADVYRAGGMEALRSQLLNPPESMASLYHVEPWGDPPASRATCMVADRGKLGRFYWRIWLQDRGFSENDADTLAAHFRGDAFRICEDPKGEKLTWRILADSPVSARQVAAAIQPRLPEGARIGVSDTMIEITRTGPAPDQKGVTP